MGDVIVGIFTGVIVGVLLNKYKLKDNLKTFYMNNLAQSNSYNDEF